MYSINENNKDVLIFSFKDSLLTKLPTKYVHDVQKQATGLEQKLDTKTIKVLEKMRKQEERIIRKLQKTDSLRAKEMARDITTKYTALDHRIQQSGKLKKYIPDLDSLSTSYIAYKIKFTSIISTLTKQDGRRNYNDTERVYQLYYSI